MTVRDYLSVHTLLTLKKSRLYQYKNAYTPGLDNESSSDLSKAIYPCKKYFSLGD